MEKAIKILKGLHPGIILESELKKRKLSKGPFALRIGEYPQTISAITKGKRNMNTALAMRIEEDLHIEEGYFMTFQIYYDIKQEREKSNRVNKKDPPKLTPSLFWDTKIKKIDWQKQGNAVIERVIERGNKSDMDELNRFYGKERVDLFLKEEKSRTAHAI